MTVILLILLGLVAIVGAVIGFGAIGWQRTTYRMRATLESQRRPGEVTIISRDELTGLPAPVQRYFRTALGDARRIVSAVNIEHAGTFNMSESGEQWKPFTSNQRVITRRPGFDWDARISMMPGMIIRVHDAYIAGEGILHAALFGLISIVNVRGTPEAALGELMRFFAETAWYPTALLPSQGVRWDAVDNTSAMATMTDGEIALTMLFRFNSDGLIASVRAEARGRMVSGTVVPTPWEGHWSNYSVRDGMCIPLQGEVSWILPAGPKPYWRGRVTNLAYEFAH